jgi:hypothetical protein
MQKRFNRAGYSWSMLKVSKFEPISEHQVILARIQFAAPFTAAAPIGRIRRGEISSRSGPARALTRLPITAMRIRA